MNPIQNFINKFFERPWRSLLFTGVVLLFIYVILVLTNLFEDQIINIRNLGLILLAIATLGSLWDFYSSDRRLDHQFNAFHGSTYLSGFYRIYFPVIILAVIVQVIVGLALIPEEDNGWGVLDPGISPSGSIIFLVASIITGLGLILLSDFEMRKRQISFAPRGKKMSYLRSLTYVLPLLGMYFAIKFFTRFLITQTAGEGALVPTETDIFTIDAEVIRAARFWIFLTDREKYMTLFAFIAVYVGMEFLLRGLLANEGRSYGLGAGGIVFVPALIQAVAFSSGTFILSDTTFYLYSLFIAFVLGVAIGITLLRTEKFSATITIALLARFLDNGSEFQTTVLNLIPQPFGPYDPLNNRLEGTVTLADNIGLFLLFFQVIIVILSPFVIMLAFEETWRVLQQLWISLKNQWFGYLIVAIAFFIIDIVFSFIAVQSPISPIVGFFLALIIIGFVLNYLFKILPPATDPASLILFTDSFGGEYPIDVVADIGFIEREKKWYEHPLQIGILGSALFLYFLFISATYRQFSILNDDEDIVFSIFLIALPTAFFGLSSYFYSRAITRGFFFQEGWRKTVYWTLLVSYIFILLSWVLAASIANFSWRNVPFFVIFAILIWEKPLRSPQRDISLGFARDGRHFTFKRILFDPKEFKEVYEELLSLPSDTIVLGAKIMAAKLNLLTEWEEIERLRESEMSKGDRIGSILAIGLIGSSSAEGVLLNQLQNTDEDVRIATYWALGRTGTPKALGKMAQTLEEHPMKNLIKIAENAILRIDPQYPLAGLRDSIILET